MSRYRKIEVRTWSDERFMGLSPIPPSGQGLWFFLLTGPHTGPIPGLFRAGRASMAEELNWDLEAFTEAFDEVLNNGMAKADFKAKLVWLPNAIRYNKPESPNVVRSWRVELDLLPECELKRVALRHIREALVEMGPSYAAAFDECTSSEKKKPDITPSPKPLVKPSVKPSAKTTPNQEQEQEQEQDKVNNLVDQNQIDPVADPVPEIFTYWQKVMKSPGSKLDTKRKKIIAAALKLYSPADVCKAIRGCSRSGYHQGDNPSKTKYRGLDLILRSAEYIDKFILLDDNPTINTKINETDAEREARIIAQVCGEIEAEDDVLEMET